MCSEITGRLALKFVLSPLIFTNVSNVRVYYCRTYYKAVCGGGGGQ